MNTFVEKTLLFVEKSIEGCSFFLPSRHPKEREGAVQMGVSRPSMAKGSRVSVIRSSRRGEGHKPKPLLHFKTRSFTSSHLHHPRDTGHPPTATATT